MDILDSRTSWARLGLSLLLALVGNVGMWSIIVILPAVEAEFATDRAGASLPFTATMLGFALGNYVIGRAVDRYGVSLCLKGAALLIAASFAGAAASPNLITLTLLQAVVGFGTAASFGPLIADVSQWFLKRRGIAVAIIASGNYLSGALMPLVLSGVLANEGWRVVYVILAAAVLLVMFPIAHVLRRPLPSSALRASEAAAAEKAGQIGLSPKTLTWLLIVAGVACCVAMSMPQVHIVAYCVDLGYGPAVGAEMLSLMLLGGVASRIVSGMLADKIGGILTLLLGSTLQMLALILYLPTTGLTSLYLVSLVFGLSQGGIVPSYAVIVREYLPANLAGEKVGLVIMATIVGMALGGWMSGWIYDLTGSYTLAFLNGIAFNAVNVAIMLMILFRGRPKRVVAQAA